MRFAVPSIPYDPGVILVHDTRPNAPITIPSPRCSERNVFLNAGKHRLVFVVFAGAVFIFFVSREVLGVLVVVFVFNQQTFPVAKAVNPHSTKRGVVIFAGKPRGKPALVVVVSGDFGEGFVRPIKMEEAFQ